MFDSCYRPLCKGWCQTQWRARANAAQTNSFEGLPFFMGARIIAHQLGAGLFCEYRHPFCRLSLKPGIKQHLRRDLTYKPARDIPDAFFFTPR